MVCKGQEWLSGQATRHSGQSGSSVSPQETSIPEELLVTVVKPGLPTWADLHVLLPPSRPTRKRSLTSDKVSILWPLGRVLPAHHRFAGRSQPARKPQWLVGTGGLTSHQSQSGWVLALLLLWLHPLGPTWPPRSQRQGQQGHLPRGTTPLPVPFHLKLVTWSHRSAGAGAGDVGSPGRIQDREEISPHQLADIFSEQMAFK